MPLIDSTINGPVPKRMTALCEPGWDIGGVAAKVAKRWRVVEVWNVSPQRHFLSLSHAWCDEHNGQLRLSKAQVSRGVHDLHSVETVTPFITPFRPTSPCFRRFWRQDRQRCNRRNVLVPRGVRDDKGNWVELL